MNHVERAKNIGMREHTISHRVRYDECDPMGIVHHSNYLRYFEMGRVELFRECGGDYRAMEELGILAVVAQVDCRYRASARYDELISIRTKLMQITAGKIVHDYEVNRDDRQLVTATVTLAMVDHEGQLQRVPQFVMDLYAP